MADLRMDGANQLAALAKDLKAAADKDLRKEMLKGIRVATEPLRKVEAPKAARANLPKRGGLNEYVAKSRFTTRTKTGPRSAAVTVVGTKKGHDLSAIDRGEVRHPVYGHAVWVTQRIKPGWWSKGLSKSRTVKQVQKELAKVLEEVAKKLAAKG